MSTANQQLHCEMAATVIATFLHQGFASARLVKAFLKKRRIPAARHGRFLLPAWFFHDLSYALQLRVWERRGRTAQLPVPLPDSWVLIGELLAALKNPKRSARRRPDKDLARLVMFVYLKHFALPDQELPGEFLLDRPEEDMLADAISRYLWQTRQGPTTNTISNP